MLTPVKIIVLLLILWAVWLVFNWLGRRGAILNQKNNQKAASIDMQQCPRCKSWVDSPCNDANCPIKS